MKDNYVSCLIILQLLMTYCHLKTSFDMFYENVPNFTFYQKSNLVGSTKSCQISPFRKLTFGKFFKNNS